MPTQAQEKAVENALSAYRNKWLKKKENFALKEEDTKFMITDFLKNVLGYIELEDFSTETFTNTRDGFLDYEIRIKKKPRFILEAKAIKKPLCDNHLSQARHYSADQGRSIKWIILMNGQCIQLHRVIIGSSVKTQMLYDFDLADKDAPKKAASSIVYLTKKSATKNELDDYWKKFDALNADRTKRALLSSKTIAAMKSEIRKASGILFDDTSIKQAIEEVINE